MNDELRLKKRIDQKLSQILIQIQSHNEKVNENQNEEKMERNREFEYTDLYKYERVWYQILQVYSAINYLEWFV